MKHLISGILVCTLIGSLMILAWPFELGLSGFIALIIEPDFWTLVFAISLPFAALFTALGLCKSAEATESLLLTSLVFSVVTLLLFSSWHFDSLWPKTSSTTSLGLLFVSYVGLACALGVYVVRKVIRKVATS